MEKNECLTGNCPPLSAGDDITRVKLSEGSGGREMQKLISEITKECYRGKWEHCDDDGAVFNLSYVIKEEKTKEKLVFTTDAFVVTPLFFPGGNIGKIAFCGTVNDLAMMGGTPLGLSLSLTLEEGLPKKELFDVMKTISDLSNEHKIPIVTGDTKVVEKGAVDKMIITTSGVAVVEKPLKEPLTPGDSIIVSGGIGEHGTALLAKRFEIESPVITDSKPLHEEIQALASKIKQAKDITRGGVAAILNEFADKNNVGIHIVEESVPMKREVRAITEVLGIEVYNLACEGRCVVVCAKENEEEVLTILKKYNPLAKKIGIVKEGKGVQVQTRFGTKILSMPSGNIVPRIC